MIWLSKKNWKRLLVVGTVSAAAIYLVWKTLETYSSYQNKKAPKTYDDETNSDSDDDHDDSGFGGSENNRRSQNPNSYFRVDDVERNSEEENDFKAGEYEQLIDRMLSIEDLARMKAKYFETLANNSEASSTHQLSRISEDCFPVKHELVQEDGHSASSICSRLSSENNACDSGLQQMPLKVSPVGHGVTRTPHSKGLEDLRWDDSNIISNDSDTLSNGLEELCWDDSKAVSEGLEVSSLPPIPKSHTKQAAGQRVKFNVIATNFSYSIPTRLPNFEVSGCDELSTHSSEDSNTANSGHRNGKTDISGAEMNSDGRQISSTEVEPDGLMTNNNRSAGLVSEQSLEIDSSRGSSKTGCNEFSRHGESNATI